MANIDKIKDLGTVTKISKNAFAVIARCPNSGQMYGITVDETGPDEYSFIWTFKVTQQQAERENYTSNTVHGEVLHDDNFPGCPYCGETSHFFCHCGNVQCCPSDDTWARCMKCGWEGEIHHATEFDITSNGGY